MGPGPFQEHPEGTLIRVWVVPRASRSELKGRHEGSLRLRVAAPPERGRANEEARRYLAERLGASVELISGSSSREKVFLARGVGRERAEEKLSD